MYVCACIYVCIRMCVCIYMHIMMSPMHAGPAKPFFIYSIKLKNKNNNNQLCSTSSH